MRGSQQFFVPGPLPGMNEMIAAAKSGRGKGNAYSRMKKDWTGQVVLAIRHARIKPMPYAMIEFEWHEENKRRNPDNIASGKKFIIDGLVEAGVLENDGWKQIVSFRDSWCDIGPAGVNVILR